MVVGDFRKGTIKGAFLQIGNSVRDIHMDAGILRDAAHYEQFLSDEQAGAAAGVSTALKAVSERDFDLIARNGYEVADATLATYASFILPNSRSWSETSGCS
jgi:NTE family protein